MSEHGEQTILFNWSKHNEERVPELWYLHAIPNGAKLPFKGRGKKRFSPEALRLKEEGLKPGVPDVFLPVPRGKYHGLYIEMKFDKNKPTYNQKIWLRKLAEQGYRTEVCWGFQAAKEVIIDYLGYDRSIYIDYV